MRSPREALLAVVDCYFFKNAEGLLEEMRKASDTLMFSNYERSHDQLLKQLANAERTAATHADRIKQLEAELSEANEYLDESEKREKELYWRKQYEDACIKISEQHDELERLRVLQSSQ